MATHYQEGQLIRADAQSSVTHKGRTATFALRDIDLDEKRDTMGLNIGRQIADAIWTLEEGK